MSSRIDLVWLGEGVAPEWPSGEILAAAASPRGIDVVMRDRLPGSNAQAWLFWGSRLGSPDPKGVSSELDRPGDVFHAGLRLGMSGLPRAIDYVAPTWMLNRDPDTSLEASSWRLSLEACLVRTEVLRKLGGVRPEFETLTGAGLELGHRWIARGALMRHRPMLLASTANVAPASPPSFNDEMRFVRYRFGSSWLRWSLLRAVLSGRVAVGQARRLLRDMSRERPPAKPLPLRHASNGEDSTERAAVPQGAKVSVLIPTVDRYPYLEVLLDQLRRQTVRPLEIVVVDQTSPERRRTDLAERFPDLPLRVLLRDKPGQCSSRNAGLETCRGEYVLFLDDDDEVPPELVEKHLRSLALFRSDVSCGVAEEDGAGELPEAFRLIRMSDVFPTNNSMIRKEALARSGLFDLAYDRGARADADLGMRLYLAGALMVLNPEISVLHHHAPTGGLRTHKARVITYASSRARVLHRHLPSATEIYLAMRYFSPSQVREMKLLRGAGTLSLRGSAIRRLLKAFVGFGLLPSTLLQIRSRARQAAAALESGPRIPRFEGAESEKHLPVRV